jgi:hypothetical protein
MDLTHEPLHLALDKRSLVKWKSMDILNIFICIIVFFNGAL